MRTNLPFSIEFRSGEPVTPQVVFAVTRAVTTGQLRPGDAFPSVRALSQQLRINPNTAHRIVSLLVADGILTVVPGVGTVVGETAARAEPPEFDDHVERLVIDARRAGWTLQQILTRVREHWARTTRRAS